VTGVSILGPIEKADDVRRGWKRRHLKLLLESGNEQTLESALELVTPALSLGFELVPRGVDLVDELN
jgi:hypothetical protein